MRFWLGFFITTAAYQPRMSKIYTPELLGQMYKNGKLPNRTMYHILIKDLELEGLAVAVSGYYCKIEKPDQIPGTYVILLGLLRWGGLETTEQVLNDMGHETDQVLGTLGWRADRRRENTRTCMSMYVVPL